MSLYMERSTGSLANPATISFIWFVCSLNTALVIMGSYSGLPRSWLSISSKTRIVNSTRFARRSGRGTIRRTRRWKYLQEMRRDSSYCLPHSKFRSEGISSSGQGSQTEISQHRVQFPRVHSWVGHVVQRGSGACFWNLSGGLPGWLASFSFCRRSWLQWWC